MVLWLVLCNVFVCVCVCVVGTELCGLANDIVYIYIVKRCDYDANGTLVLVGGASQL